MSPKWGEAFEAFEAFRSSSDCVDLICSLCEFRSRVASCYALARKKGRLKSRRRERSSRGRTPPTRIGATSCGMHRNPMPFGRERWHRPPRFAHVDSLRMGVGSSEAVRCIRSSNILPPTVSSWIWVGQAPRLACFHDRGGLRERLVRAAPPDLTSLDPCFGPVQHSSLSRTFLPPVAGGRGRKSRPAPVRRMMLLPRCGAPRPPLTTGRTMTCRASLVVAGMWSARGRGAALGRRCRRPVAAAAARVQGPGWCRLARAPAALWRCRSRARPRPLLGPAGG